MKMRPTDFAYHLSGFLTTYLAGLRDLSKNTIQSYRDTFTLLLRFFSEAKKIMPDKISIETVTKESTEDFLSWLEIERNCSVSTRNQRLAAIHSFFRYLQFEKPECMHHCQRILSIPLKKTPKPSPAYLTNVEVGNLLAMPNLKTGHGRRDATLLSLLYDSGARVQELADLTPRSLRLEEPYCVTLFGKGRKTRRVPIMKQTATLLDSYLKEQGIDSAEKLEHPLFFNARKEKLTRQGINYVIAKYASEMAASAKITAHTLRHSKAMALTEADVNPIYIRDILGHIDLKTTGIYSKSNLEIKRKALEKIEDGAIPDKADWTGDDGLMVFLKNLGK
jgi:site-specific recombinase XerD